MEVSKTFPQGKTLAIQTSIFRALTDVPSPIKTGETERNCFKPLSRFQSIPLDWN